MLKDLVCGGGSMGGLACPASRLLVNDGSPNRLSREGPLPGGGGKDVLATGGSVATLWIGGGGALATQMLAVCA
jgi:hypothetical protein